VWWLGGRLVEERERACDEEVLRRGSNPEAYAEGILKVCEFYLASPLDCVAGVSGADLKKRIEEIMGQRLVKRLNSGKKALLGAAGVLVLAGPLAVGVLRVPAVLAQGDGTKFEVASIRLCPSGGGRGDSKMGPPGGNPAISPGRLSTGCVPLATEYPLAGLMQRVYGRLALGHPLPLGTALPVQGGPSWIYSDYYEINAKAAGNASEETMIGPMLQALLEDRFRLKVHRASRNVNVYVLTLARGGSKLQEVQDGSCTKPNYSTYPPPALPAGQKYCFNTGVGGRKGPNTMLNQDETTVGEFSKLLGLVLDRPVVDKTGLRGKYNFHLEFAIDQNTPGVLTGFPAPPSDDTPAPSIFTVVQQQLGLKLEPAKGGRDYLVIDHVERPSEN
jgi:bla regulator protein BlaR1